jgi:hypothetical protein
VLKLFWRFSRLHPTAHLRQLPGHSCWFTTAVLLKGMEKFQVTELLAWNTNITTTWHTTDWLINYITSRSSPHTHFTEIGYLLETEGALFIIPLPPKNKGRGCWLCSSGCAWTWLPKVGLGPGSLFLFRFHVSGMSLMTVTVVCGALLLPAFPEGLIKMRRWMQTVSPSCLC